MKKFFLLFLSLFSSIVSSQNVEKSILLKDFETNLPIEDASILILKSKQILLSNANGEATFVLNGISNIQITHTSYVGITIRSSTLKEKENIVF
ncbi:hypothetical protein [Flavobacterium sp.]|uniref:hypothetical protein n=1 Tax=Flavobacterium sp. TaxID=239 RepID=UPI0037523054